jgi:hypothetical protein
MGNMGITILGAIYILPGSLNRLGSDGIMLDDKSIHVFHIPFPPIVYFHASMLNHNSTIVI